MYLSLKQDKAAAKKSQHNIIDIIQYKNRKTSVFNLRKKYSTMTIAYDSTVNMSLKQTVTTVFNDKGHFL